MGGGGLLAQSTHVPLLFLLDLRNCRRQLVIGLARFIGKHARAFGCDAFDFRFGAFHVQHPLGHFDECELLRVTDAVEDVSGNAGSREPDNVAAHDSMIAQVQQATGGRV